jgi:hypothetical protein
MAEGPRNSQQDNQLVSVGFWNILDKQASDRWHQYRALVRVSGQVSTIWHYLESEQEEACFYAGAIVAHRSMG